LKKQIKAKKLVILKETLTNLQQVTGGSVVYKTVIIIRQSDRCESIECPTVYT